MIHFKENLKFLTTTTTINQSELARILGKSRQAINNLFKSNDTKLSTILEIAEVYSIDAKDLLFSNLSEKDGEKNAISNKKQD